MKYAIALLTGVEAKLGSSLQAPMETDAESMLEVCGAKKGQPKVWEERVSTFTIKQYLDTNGKPGKRSDLTDGDGKASAKKHAYFAEIRSEFKTAIEAATAKATTGVAIWTEEVLNFTCPEEAERACEADHAFERFAKIAHSAAPDLEIIRLKVPIYAMPETGRYGLMDPYDMMIAAEEEASGSQGSGFPRLGYMRTGCNKDKKTHGRLYNTYDDYGDALTGDDPETKKSVAAFLHSRDRRGLCAGDDDPTIAVNGCCGR